MHLTTDFNHQSIAKHKNSVISTHTGQHLFETAMNYTLKNTLFSEGNWGILETTDAFTGRDTPSALAHQCDKFQNEHLHHIYHSIQHTIRCTECGEQVPESVETLWRLYNMDMHHAQSYVTIFIQSANNKTDKNLGNLNKSKCLKVQC